MANLNQNFPYENQQKSTNSFQNLIDLESNEDGDIQTIEESQFYQDSYQKNGSQKFTCAALQLQSNIEKNRNQQTLQSNIIEIEDDICGTSQKQNICNLALTPIHKNVQMGDFQSLNNFDNQDQSDQSFGKQQLFQMKQIHNKKKSSQQKQISNQDLICIEDDDKINEEEEEEKVDCIEIKKNSIIKYQKDQSNIHNIQKQIFNQETICIEDEDKIIQEQKDDCFKIQKVITIYSQQESSNMQNSINTFSTSNKYFYQQLSNKKQKVITDSLLPRESLQNTKVSQNNKSNNKEVIEINDDNGLNQAEVKKNNIFQTQKQNNNHLNNIFEQINKIQIPSNQSQQIQSNAFQLINVDELSDEFQNNYKILDQNQILNKNNIFIENENHFLIIDEEQGLGQYFNNTELELSGNKQQNEQMLDSSIDNNYLINDYEEISDSSQITEVHEDKSDQYSDDEQQLDNQIIIDQSLVDTTKKQKFIEIDSYSSSENYNQIFQENENILNQQKEKEEKTSKSRNKNSTKQQNKQQIIQIKGPFQLEGFTWEMNINTEKKYLKQISNQNSNGDQFKQTAFQNLKQNRIFGKKVHTGIELYLNEGDQEYLKEILQHKNDVNLLINQIETIKNYLLKRGMVAFHVEYQVQSDKLRKIIDYLSYNVDKQECIIVDWKFNKSHQNLLFKQSYCHFQQQILATQYHLQNKYQCEFKVNLLIVPLKNVQNLKIIEYNLEDIQFLLQDNNLIKYYYFQCTLEGFQNYTLLNIAQKIKEQKVQNSKDFDYFNNLENAQKHLNYQEQSNYQKLSQLI
ncbi:hypothetical protein ABPG73_001909 [Tetrahymena malaccensis]